MVTAIIVAGGSGSRMGKAINKAYLPLAGKKVIEHTVNAFLLADDIKKIVIVARQEDMEQCLSLFNDKKIVVTTGGATRQESVLNGLMLADTEFVAIHDAARALIEPKIINKTVEECKKHGAAAVGVSCVDTLKKVDESGFIVKTVDRNGIYRIQTPQIFKLDKIKSAHYQAMREGFDATDDCALYERYIGKVKITEGDGNNIKLTYPEDMVFAEAILKETR